MEQILDPKLIDWSDGKRWYAIPNGTYINIYMSPTVRAEWTKEVIERILSEGDNYGSYKARQD